MSSFLLYSILSALTVWDLYQTGMPDRIWFPVVLWLTDAWLQAAKGMPRWLYTALSYVFPVAGLPRFGHGLIAFASGTGTDIALMKYNGMRFGRIPKLATGLALVSLACIVNDSGLRYAVLFLSPTALAPLKPWIWFPRITRVVFGKQRRLEIHGVGSVLGFRFTWNLRWHYGCQNGANIEWHDERLLPAFVRSLLKRLTPSILDDLKSLTESASIASIIGPSGLKIVRK